MLSDKIHYIANLFVLWIARIYRVYSDCLFLVIILLHAHTGKAYRKLVSDNLGTVGMLLSVPLTMIVKIGFENSPEGRWLAVLLSDEESVVKEVEQAQKN